MKKSKIVKDLYNLTQVCKILEYLYGFKTKSINRQRNILCYQWREIYWTQSITDNFGMEGGGGRYGMFTVVQDSGKDLREKFEEEDLFILLTAKNYVRIMTNYGIN